MRLFQRKTRITTISTLLYIGGCIIVIVAPVAQGLSSSSTSIPPRPDGRPKIRALKQICSHPLAFTIDDFCDAPMCAALQKGSDDARLHFATLIAGELFAGTWGRNDGLRYNLSKSSDANNNNDNNCEFPEGLHVDTNNDSVFRSVTAILYLNDIPHGSGGATVFPLANALPKDPRLGAARRLLGDQMAHTRGSVTATTAPGMAGRGTRAADAAQLEASTAAMGLRIQPEMGKLLLFFSRTEDGKIDPRSWHGGERLIVGHLPSSQNKSSSSSRSSSSGGFRRSDSKSIRGVDDAQNDDDATSDITETIIEKNIMTLFKEIDYGTAHPDTYETTFENYLAPQIAEQRRALQSLAESHAPFFEQ